MQEINSNILSYAWQGKAALCGLALIYSVLPVQYSKCVSCHLRFFPSNAPKYSSISVSGMGRSFANILLNGTKTKSRRPALFKPDTATPSSIAPPRGSGYPVAGMNTALISNTFVRKHLHAYSMSQCVPRLKKEFLHKNNMDSSPRKTLVLLILSPGFDLVSM